MTDRALFRAPLKLRHPRGVVKDRMELAALAMGAAPDLWQQIAGSTRRSLGVAQPAPPARVRFLEDRTGEGLRCLPVEEPEEIGRGGFHVVYRTRDLVLSLPFTVRERRAARSAAELTHYLLHDRIIDDRLRELPAHPVIPACYGRCRLGESSCELYAYAPGVNLRSYVARRGLTYGALLDFASGAALGLAHLHRHGLVHADVKPDNFCVDERRLPDGRTALRVFLIDFDIATTPEQLVRSYLLGTTFAGTPAYMPPENFAGSVPDRPGDRERMACAKDVYALGLTLRQLATGSVAPAGGRSACLNATATLGDRWIAPLPASVPPGFAALAASLSAADWRERPTARDAVRAIRKLRRAARPALLDTLVAEPRPRVRYATFEEALAAGPSLGPYLLVDPEFEARGPAGEGRPGTIVELEDAYGRRLLGIPFTFADEGGATAFYHHRFLLLHDLDRIRRRHPGLFGGAFRDLVRTEDGPDGPYHVWFVRPLLPGAMTLDQFLVREEGLALRERVAVLRRIAHALEALEEAGYTHAGLSARSVFFAPLDGSEGDDPAAGPTRIDVRGSRTYRQELMGLGDVRRTCPGEPDPTPGDLVRLAAETGVLDRLPAPRAAELRRLPRLPGWRERAELLRAIEQAL